MSAGRNDPCPCGSGRKYKKCCLPKEEAQAPVSAVAWSRAEKKLLIKSSDEYPVAACLINPNWRDLGLATIAVARRQPNGRLIMGLYLVDVFCLGLKNTFCNADLPVARFEGDFLAKSFPEQAPISIGINHAKEIIFGAIDYAGKLGFDPHPDFELSRHVLGTEEWTRQQDIIFGGPDGKPRYISGPDDDARGIIQKLMSRLGREGFDFEARL